MFRSPTISQDQTILSGPGGLEDTATLGVLLVCLLMERCLGLLQAPRSRLCCLLLEYWRVPLHLVSCWSSLVLEGCLGIYLLVFGCLGLLQASLKQNLASGQVVLGDTATLIVLLVLCYLHFGLLDWKYGGVFRFPTVSQDQTILSGPGGLEGAAALRDLLVSFTFVLDWRCDRVFRSPAFSQP